MNLRYPSFLVNKKDSFLFFTLLAVSLFISFVLRNPFYVELLGGDTKGVGGYAHNFNRIIDWASLKVLYYYNDYLFSTFAYLLWSLGLSDRVYLLSLEIISTLFLFSAYKNIIFSQYKSDIQNNLNSSFTFKSSFLILLLAFILVLSASSFYLLAVNALRQFLAVCIFLYGVSLVLNKKNKSGYLFLFTSYFAHSSSIFIVGVFLISRLLSFRKIFILFIVALSLKAIVGAQSFSQLLIYLNSIGIPLSLKELVDYIIYKVSVLSADTTGFISIHVKLAHAGLFSLFMLCVSLLKKNYIFSSLVIFYVSFVFFCIMISDLPSMTNRFLLYCGVIEPILISYCVFFIKPRQRVLIALLLSFFALTYLMLLLLFHPSIRAELMLNQGSSGHINQTQFIGSVY
jgi:hypothetical protein